MKHRSSNIRQFYRRWSIHRWYSDVETCTWIQLFSSSLDKQKALQNHDQNKQKSKETVNKRTKKVRTFLSTSTKWFDWQQILAFNFTVSSTLLHSGKNPYRDNFHKLLAEKERERASNECEKPKETFHWTVAASDERLVAWSSKMLQEQ